MSMFFLAQTQWNKGLAQSNFAPSKH